MGHVPEDLREHLVAVIEAAPELPDHGRELADVFLEEMSSRYRLVPRQTETGWSGEMAGATSAFLLNVRRVWPLVVGAALLLLILPLLLFVMVHVIPVAFMAVVLLLAFRRMTRRMVPRHAVWR